MTYTAEQILNNFSRAYESPRASTWFISWIQTTCSVTVTLRLSQPTWTTRLPVGCYCAHPPSPFIIITQPTDATYFTISRFSVYVLHKN